MIVAIEPLLVSPEEGAAMIACGKTKFFELISEGKLEAKKQGRSTVITVDSLRRYVASLPSIAPTLPS